MKRVLGLIVILVLAFYVLWPAWTGYVIREALQNRDPARLATKVDFERVQASLRPAVTLKVEEGFERSQSQLGAAGGAILGQLRKEMVPKIVDASLKSLLTPETIIRIVAEGGSIKESLDRLMGDQIGRGMTAGGAGAPVALPQGLGGLFGKVLPQAGGQPATTTAQAPASTPTAAVKSSYSLANVKSFAFNGPLSFRVGVAKDRAAGDADVTAELSFAGGDWKVTGLVPRL